MEIPRPNYHLAAWVNRTLAGSASTYAYETPVTYQPDPGMLLGRRRPLRWRAYIV